MSDGLVGKAIKAKRKHKAELESATGLGSGTTSAAPVKQVATSAPRNTNTAGPKVTTTASRAAAQKAAIQKRVAARVASGKGKVVKKKTREMRMRTGLRR